MKSFYIRTSTYGTDTPYIIDEEAMYQAERRMNNLNPDEFMYHCEADNMNDAKEQYWEEFGEMVFDQEAEKDYP